MKQKSPAWVGQAAAELMLGGIVIYWITHGWWEWRVPCLIFVSYLAFMVVFQLLWEKLHPKRGEDECTHCGYSLTGNVSGVCPECGTPVRP